MQRLFSIFVSLVLTLSMLMGAAAPVFSFSSGQEAPADHPAEPEKGAEEKTRERKKDKKGEAGMEDEEKDKPFKDVVKKFKAVEGLFTLYVKEDENKVLMEIKSDQLDKIFLCNVTLDAGDGMFFDSGAMLDNFPFVFKKVGKKIQFIHKNIYYRAEPGSAAARAVARGVSDSILGSAKIESASHPDRKSVLVDISEFFLKDYAMVSTGLSEGLKTQVAFDAEESYFGSLKSFPMNTEIETVLHFQFGKPIASQRTHADARSMQHHYRWGLSALPETGFRPRLADDRVGHFLTMHQDYTTVENETPYVRYVSRWHLEKADPAVALSAPKQPIVFWLENTIPQEYRQAVADGILGWNRAFEKIGFKDAIVVKQQPDDADWDPADVRYSTVRWIVNPGAVYAVGPSYTNPFTGQIYDADIRVSADVPRYIYHEFTQFTDPVAMLRAELEPKPAPFMALTRFNPFSLCNYSQGAVRQAAFGRSLLQTRGDFSGDKAALDKYVHDALAHWVIHEVGHTLGLRHNFRASAIHSLDQMNDSALCDTEGITGSVMDYIPVNLAEKNKPQGPYWQTIPGIYDEWAIEYAYRPVAADSQEAEKAELEKIARKMGDSRLTFGTDEDAMFIGLDPYTNRYDMGSDPIAYYKLRAGFAKELMAKMEQEFEKDGARYQKLRSVFGQVMGEYFSAVGNVPKFVGGISHHRDHVGDPAGRLPFEPLPAAKQREALDFLQQYVFAPDAFSVPPSLLNKLTPERFEMFDWNHMTIRPDFPVHGLVLAMQESVLDRLYTPLLLSRLEDLPLHYGKGEKPFTMAEMFQNLRNGIWSELDKGSDVNSFRRNLQRAHLMNLVNLALRSEAGAFAPEDATSLARADLLAIRRKTRQALTRTDMGAATRAHLEETDARITAALNAGLERMKAPSFGMMGMEEE
jgi:hypothetical protein